MPATESTVQKTLRLPSSVVEDIEQMARKSRRDFSTTVRGLLEDAVKINRCPGIVLTEGVRGRQAKIAGTGIEVWEVIASFRSVGDDLKRLQKAFHWVAPQQLRMALCYYEFYPEEIDALIRENEGWNPERIKEEHPYISQV